MAEEALNAASILHEEDRIEVAVINGRFAKPLDVLTITRAIESGKPLVVCEDHALIGGFGSGVMELAAARGLPTTNIHLIGLPDRFISHASRAQQLTEAGLDATHIASAVKDMVRTRATYKAHKH